MVDGLVLFFPTIRVTHQDQACAIISLHSRHVKLTTETSVVDGDFSKLFSQDGHVIASASFNALRDGRLAQDQE